MALRTADFAKLGLLPPSRPAYNWRDLTFFEDEPVPIDLQQLSEEFHSWNNIGQEESEENEQARKLKRRFEFLFGKLHV